MYIVGVDGVLLLEALRLEAADGIEGDEDEMELVDVLDTSLLGLCQSELLLKLEPLLLDFGAQEEE